MRRALERFLVAVARRAERPLAIMLARRWVRALLHRRALLAWRSVEAPLILCYGNINRSPFAAALARAHGRPGAYSAGFHPRDGRISPEATIECGIRYGVDLAAHRSALVSQRELARAQAIFVFDLENVARVAALDPRALRRTHLLGALDDDPHVLIADPHGRGQTVLEQTVARIAEVIEHAEAVP